MIQDYEGETMIFLIHFINFDYAVTILGHVKVKGQSFSSIS